MDIVDRGIIGYEDAVRLQLERLGRMRENPSAPEALFLLEHRPVITLGRHGGREHLLADPGRLSSLGVELVQSSRGGSITCHFPGQLVAYPLVRLDRRTGGLKGFVHLLEDAAMAACSRFGVLSHRTEGRPGVWIGQKKLASIGVALRHWITWHGLALNVARDLWLFGHITLCGLADASPTSLSLETGRDIPVEEVKHVFTEEFQGRFQAP